MRRGTDSNRETGIRASEKASLWGPLTVSLAFHLLLLTSVPMLLPDPVKDVTTDILRVKLEPLPLEGQIVDVLDNTPSDPLPPRDRHFLSTANRNVNRETQARFTGPDPTTPSGAPSSSSSPQHSPVAPKGSESFQLEMPESFLDEILQEPKVSSLAPSNYLPEIAFGDRTLLNTTQFRFSSFFIRMKRQIEAHWRPARVLAHQRPDRNRYVTQIDMVLSPSGHIKTIRLVKSSGNSRLDEEAVSAIREGAPFLNPPADLIRPDGQVHVEDFHFIVETRFLF